MSVCLSVCMCVRMCARVSNGDLPIQGTTATEEEYTGNNGGTRISILVLSKTTCKFVHTIDLHYSN